jgi:hypothetical protein
MSTHIDVRGGNVNNVGHDQHNVYHITIDGSVPQQERRQFLRDFCHVPLSSTSTPTLSFQTRVFAHAYRFETGSAGSIASDLIDDIEKLLADPTESTDNDQELKGELELLRQTLILTDRAVQTFEYTPLGQNLANIVSFPSVLGNTRGNFFGIF